MSFFKGRFIWVVENCQGIKFDVNVLHQTTHKKKKNLDNTRLCRQTCLVL